VLFHGLIILVFFIREIQLAAKKKDDSDVYIALGMILFIPFLVFAWRHYNRLKREFAANASSQRIFDTESLWYPLGVGGVITAVLAYLILSLAHGPWYLSIIFAPCLGLLFLYLGRQVARWLAATYFGVLVDPLQDRVLLPCDMASYGVADYLSFRFLQDMGVVDSIPLSGITKITREAGKSLYVHGAFGSRAMTFTNKQKRDECIAAIESASRRSIRAGGFE
jgi:hypothetical protein